MWRGLNEQVLLKDAVSAVDSRFKSEKFAYVNDVFKTH